MIVTISDFLQSVMNKEKELIKKYEIVRHGPTIGDMYEGLTSDLLNKAIFEGLDVRIASGKIKNKEGEFSNEIDCMIVEGEGERIPYTDKYIYDMTQVIAVLEIKKNLYIDNLIDSYNKMKKIYNLSDLDPELLNMRGFRDAFRHIVKAELPSYEEVQTSLDYNKQIIYHNLLIEEMLPVRIIFGYYGYKTEYALREAFFRYLSNNSNITGHSPAVFPDLIICDNSSLAKLDAMPYIGRIDEKGYWDFYGSSIHNPLLLLLEFIWTKLSYRYNLNSNIFGEDLEFESFHPYLKGKAHRMDDGTLGWEIRYQYIKKSNLSHEPSFIEWEPAELNEVEWFVVNWLCMYCELNINKPGFRNWLDEKTVTLETMIEGLTQKNLIAFNNDQITLLTDQCQVVTLNGKWYAAENKSGRLTNWINKIMNNRE
ncbi:DUF6602 domain-containing protein [Paenibacillus sp. FSL W8-0426]|uniref:DUF6602 domain-containing protein n=1 Tax=Paenibacillus sp. FSL W8-0426 TaxID=2921714 RepID=UPI0030DB444F